MHTIVETEEFEHLWPLYWTERNTRHFEYSLLKIRMPVRWFAVPAEYEKYDGLGKDRGNLAYFNLCKE